MTMSHGPSVDPPGQEKTGVGWYLFQLFSSMPLEVHNPNRRAAAVCLSLVAACIGAFVVEIVAVGAGDLVAVAADVAQVRSAVPDAVVKVILETALWTPGVVRSAAEAALDGGADMVKTSTGFHPAGGATVEAVRALRSAVGVRAGVKASGGIRDLAGALAMVEAGADRLGCSATEQLLAEFD
jgi:deoxyribose-phosphate aldolase